ncbi:bis(5'-nucleosyl)-tetraphosphatase (symmetrical) YqeK [Brevibacillus sp. NRS-1366]|uniref:bis(5'-nucleosyl)-tetraphosphatase (symmetrical) YqeK n=1 Tax=Brevibacillus sp. NRS-1366 TaxID=3233899 RepID=UPI003D223088
MHDYEPLVRGWQKTNDVASDAQSLLCLHGCEHTFFHSKRVAHEAARLANVFGVDPQAAMTAGYLHDISAVYPNQVRIEVAESLGIEILPEEKAFPMIIHQKISKAMARDLFSIKDSAILSAIECHTTLKTNPSRLDLVLFVADKIEWDQTGTPPYVQQLIPELEKSLERAAHVYLSHLWEQREKLRVVHPWLRDAYLDLSRGTSYVSEGGECI